MKYIVLRTEVVTVTEVYEVDVNESDRYPTTEDRAISATVLATPKAKYPMRDVRFMVMKEER